MRDERIRGQFDRALGMIDECVKSLAAEVGVYEIMVGVELNVAKGLPNDPALRQAALERAQVFEKRIKTVLREVLDKRRGAVAGPVGVFFTN